MQEMVDALAGYILHFSLPRSELDGLNSQYGLISAEDFLAAFEKLREEAMRIFMTVQKKTHRNGEAGELLLYVLTEWILSAPQIIAKMSLKTNRDMPVYGADGVHARFCGDTQRLLLYWGESKLHSRVSDAITDALSSIVEALNPEKMQHEIDLVQRNIEFAGLGPAARDAFLRYLDPYEESYNARHDVTTCLVGFDFDGFSAITRADSMTAEEKFSALAQDRLADLAPQVARKLKDCGLAGHPVELFFFPVPSVERFREIFQDKIGWRR
ncbi:DUF1837 domain-containing protein [Rhizobium sp. CIAT894]|uniref:HamA C-terminal domain-containing protein n=1 Tax=Rhizobium sp. CIAT894 TaxID=2020312 RepID=UPI001FD8A9E0|nr:DUF1837 domain-containing protein [Rhizobium sp. CIAT894]